MSNEAPQSQKKAKGAQRGNMNASFHGVYALMRWRHRNGLPDGRTAFGRNFREREKEYSAALGGDLSPMMATLVEDTVWLDLYVMTCDQYLSAIRQFVRKGKTHPLVDVRIKLANSRRENLKIMGFKRVAKEEDSLESYIERTYGNRDGGDEDVDLSKPPTAMQGLDENEPAKSPTGHLPASTDGSGEEER